MSRSGALRSVALLYDRLNTTHPVATKAATSGALLGAGDILCQTFEQRRHDWQRTARMCGWGLAINGPAGHMWYKALDRAIITQGARGVVAKTAADQRKHITFPFISPIC